MVQFSKLRLSGFKSFVDPTELLIESGLTGIVGPNGCGKSNLVEALRWVMGEISAKQMRGGEMDDVIFNGTADRPARNIAEVSLVLNNEDRMAPAAYNGDDELEVTRRIERGSGSAYSVNNQDVRAKDVQLLFADSATGARSTAMVSQGRVGALINAKPTARRAILEEAAGITGLHSRRHEAELRLRGAESNLERLDDVLTTLETQLQGLKRQARQAARYRSVGDRIRHQEGILLHLRWRDASGEKDGAAERLREFESKVAEMTGITSHIATEQAKAAEILPQLRRFEAEAAAALQRLVLARESLDEEERRLAETLRECEARIDQCKRDIERETELLGDAAQARTRLEEEGATLTAAGEGETEANAQATARVETAAAKVTELENRLTALTEEVANAEARRTGLERQISEIEARIDRLRERRASSEGQRTEVEQESAELGGLEAAEIAAETADKSLEAARETAERAEFELTEARKLEATERETLQIAEKELDQLRAEEAALANLMGSHDKGEWTPLLDEVNVEPGYEAALGAALGEDLDAPTQSDAPMHWETLPPFDQTSSLANDVPPLSRFVEAPQALARRLSQIGLVADNDQGRTLQPRLAPGQRLVSREGALWRWDGFTVEAGAASPAAVRLAQRNRLAELTKMRPATEESVATIKSRFQAAEENASSIHSRERSAQDSLRQAHADLHQARDTLATQTRAASAHQSRLAALTESIERLAADLTESETELTTAQESLNLLEDTTALRDEITRLREELTGRRDEMIDCQGERDRLKREANARQERIAHLQSELQSWTARTQGAETQLSDLKERLAAAETERQSLVSRPEDIAQRRQLLQDQVDKAEDARKKAADALAEAETGLREVDSRLKTEETNLHQAREGRVRAEAQVEQVDQSLKVLSERINERLNCAPGDILAEIKVSADEDFPDPDSVETRLERLFSERDNMGPVNLRAEQEAEEISEQSTTLQSEREDLVAAIARLRQGISSLNREGRERLLAAFKEVDKHFQDLFVRLFGGGHAHMELIESDDPLEAGLEIFASPPGKKLQSLTLLSGGEQALTALSLLFAVFLTNPAPICVLDEVDAPLDDANVDRFCALISEIAHSSATRFLLITHHRITMARVDRLYGVTMMERGVSQFVSVDMQNAERLRDAG
ncbi:MAG: chromosome segregation protein SMC [Rhodospirillaceae bacterium]|nr:chromosome segregation protein SMC [Rhodospirillaceae bacterium]